MRRPSPLPRLLIALLAALPPVTAAVEAQSLYPAFGKNKIQYREFDWQIYRSPHFDVYHYTDDPAQLEKIVSFAESAYDRLSREFDFQIQKPTPLIVYETHSAFEQNNIIVNFIPEGVGAFASPVRNRMVLPVDLPDGELFALVLHELTHIFQFEILFQGRIARGLGVPQWVMEGMASYMAKDEGTSDKMFLRDAVVNDRIPSILERGVSGFFAYRFGHAAFDFIEHRWGKEGFRDFVYEFRNTLGGRVEKAVERAFRIEPEDFDAEFRRWLRQKYLPQLVATGEPSDFGRRFRYGEGQMGETLSPAVSPSGDLVAAISTVRSDVDVVLFDGRNRRMVSNLTRGFSSDYQYLSSQFVTSGPRMGRDLAFAPDGNRVAVFAKRHSNRADAPASPSPGRPHHRSPRRLPRRAVRAHAGLRSAYKRIDSFYSGTELASAGLPEGLEKEILESLKDKVPASVFTTPYRNPEAGSPEKVRANLREADRLLKEAGWEIRDGKRVNAATGRQLVIELLAYDSTFERVLLFLKPSLERLGIGVSVRIVDPAQYENRMRDFDFDVTTDLWAQSLSPGNEQREYWGSAAAARPGSRNTAGIKDPAVDALIDRVVFAKSREELVAAVKALYRVLLAGDYVVPQWTYDKERTARWDRFGHPEKMPRYGASAFPAIWWYDEDKAKRIGRGG